MRQSWIFYRSVEFKPLERKERQREKAQPIIIHREYVLCMCECVNNEGTRLGICCPERRPKKVFHFVSTNDQRTPCIWQDSFWKSLEQTVSYRTDCLKQLGTSCILLDTLEQLGTPCPVSDRTAWNCLEHPTSDRTAWNSLHLAGQLGTACNTPCIWQDSLEQLGTPYIWQDMVKWWFHQGKQS